MTAPEAFVEWVNDAILSLPQDLKAMLRIVEDPEIGPGRTGFEMALA